jgi:hypothetical protein
MSLGRQWIRLDLYLERLGRRILPVLAVEIGAFASRVPQTEPLPAGVGFVDPTTDILAAEAEWLGDPDIDELAIHQRQRRLAPVGRCNRHVGAEAEPRSEGRRA